ncbi:19066_t:CDS:2, partial [Gigaspora margarita]
YKDERPVRYILKDRTKIFVLGRFCINGKTFLHCFQRTMDGEYYVEIFKNHVREVQRLFYMMDWSSYSLDLNYVENLWSIIKTKVEHHGPKNFGELELYMKQEWTKVLRSVLIRLANIIQECCQATIGANDEYMNVLTFNFLLYDVLFLNKNPSLKNLVNKVLSTCQHSSKSVVSANTHP